MPRISVLRKLVQNRPAFCQFHASLGFRVGPVSKAKRKERKEKKEGRECKEGR